MTLLEVHDWIRYMLGKERGGFITPPEIDALLHRAQMWHYTDEYDVYGKTQKIQDSLSPFHEPFTYTSSGAGLVTLPVDETVVPCYQHLLGINVQYYDNALSRIRYKPIKIISEDQIAERLDSQILAPSITDPVGVETGKGKIQLYPAAAISGKGSYLRLPRKPVFSYTLGVDGRTITYDAGGSTQMEWNEASMNKILIKAIQFAGVNLADDGTVQYTELKTKQDI